MDEAALERLVRRRSPRSSRASTRLHGKQQIASLIAHFNRIGVPAPFSPNVHQDAKDSTRYVFDLGQDGLGMPDRDYYLLNDRQLMQTRALYVQHVAKHAAPGRR